MTLKEMKVNTFSLIEEYYPELKGLAEDTDVLNKINGVVNNVAMDLMKYKKIPVTEELIITKGTKALNLIDTIGEEYYQINKIVGLGKYSMIDDVTIEVPEDFEGQITVYYYKYPKMVKTIFSDEDARVREDESYTFDLAPDLLHIMPYGIASDLLKMDMISGYGRYFYERYNELKDRINPNRTAGMIYVEGGVDF